jgi:anti-sigma factor RsiW
MRRRHSRAPLTADPDCHQVGAVLQAYLDGELGAKDAEVVAEHLEHCERCGVEAITVERVIRAIRRQRPDLGTEPLERLAGFVDRLADGDGDDRAGGGGRSS